MLLLFFCTFCDCKPTLIPYQELSKLLPKGSVDVNFDLISQCFTSLHKALE